VTKNAILASVILMEGIVIFNVLQAVHKITLVILTVMLIVTMRLAVLTLETVRSGVPMDVTTDILVTLSAIEVVTTINVTLIWAIVISVPLDVHCPGLQMECVIPSA